MGKHLEEMKQDYELITKRKEDLTNFINEQVAIPSSMREIDIHQISLIGKQNKIMEEYLKILSERIDYDINKKKNYL